MFVLLGSKSVIFNGSIRMRYLFSFSLLVLLSACTVYEYCSAPAATKADADPQLVSVAELSGVHFQHGRPTAGEGIEKSLAEPLSAQLKNLQYDASLLMKHPGDVAEVNGYTDDEECVEHECDALSLRRAEVVYEWLVRNGVPKSQLKMPAGFGSEIPISLNTTELGRANNRRVEVNLL